MKMTKRISAIMLSAIFVVLCFAGCSSSTSADEITAETMLIAYTEDNAPFIYEENGEVKGFDVEVFGKIFKDIKNDYKNYKFVKVEEGYKIGEDVYCVDADGKDCIAYIMAGGVMKDVGDVNNTYTFTDDIINDRIITVVNGSHSTAITYSELVGARVGVVSDVAMTALDKHATIKNNMKSVKAYDDTASALDDLLNDKLDAVVIDEFNFNVAENKDNFYAIDGELDNISYVYAFSKWDWFAGSVNDAIKELKSPDYNDADEFTPIVEEYFGYNASSFPIE